MSFPLVPPRIPQPNHRHGAPSGPWPFLDLNSEIDPQQLAHPQDPAVNPDWSKYPQSLYPNWTPAQQQTSGITKAIDNVSRDPCIIRHVNVHDEGIFAPDEEAVVTEENKAEYWKKLEQQMPDGVRLRALFLQNLSGPVLQMLGTKYNVEPFFFSSSLKWIPARYQESVGEGDHITFTLTFIRAIRNPTTSPTSSGSLLQLGDQVIDTHAPLALSSSNHILLPDILAIHLVRAQTGSTIISYHPPQIHRTTTAEALRTRLLAAGQSVYWNNIFASTISADPTFVLLALLWYPIYAFDEALEALYLHICWLESRVMATTDPTFTQELHVVRAHLLHYTSLLEDFRKTVVFVAQTRNPVLEHASDTLPAETIAFAMELMRKESTNLLNEIARLEQNRSMQDRRLKNVMNLAFSSIILEDSRRMQSLTEAAVRDSAVMKQISYLTMIFLPASLAAAVFGMNVKEITPNNANGTLGHYLALALPLSVVTIWIIMAFQYRKKDPTKLIHQNASENEMPVWSKLNWPLLIVQRGFRRAATSKGSAESARKSRRNSRAIDVAL
ncbi:hypothetical protein DFH09DRAFT_1024289 [Mycena vulgaris]|nr:hypothetical protein DFH09DRAFT_1024289 [Mycena vulgaris]